MIYPKPESVLAAVLASLRSNPPRSPHQSAQDAATLAALGRRAQRLAARECSVPMTDAQQRRAESDRERWRWQAAEILTCYGVDAESISVRQDPRGFGMRWAFPSGAGDYAPSNDGDGGWGV